MDSLRSYCPRCNAVGKPYESYICQCADGNGRQIRSRIAAIGLCRTRCTIAHHHLVPIGGHRCVMCFEHVETNSEEIMREVRERIVVEVRDGACSSYMMRRFGEECRQAINARRNGIGLRLEFLPDVIADIIIDYSVPRRI